MKELKGLHLPHCDILNSLERVIQFLVSTAPGSQFGEPVSTSLHLSTQLFMSGKRTYYIIILYIYIFILDMITFFKGKLHQGAIR